MIAPFTPEGRLDVAKLPMAVVPALITSKLCPLGVKLFINEPVRVPPRLAVPDTDSTSYCVPAVVPPMSIFRFEPVESCRSPFIVRMSAVPSPPGVMIPWLRSPAAALLPTVMVPLPLIVPVLVKPAVRLKVAPEATSIVLAG